jgi:hypothetical protein
MRYSSNISYRDTINEEVEKLMQKINKKPKKKNWLVRFWEWLICMYKKIAKKL